MAGKPDFMASHENLRLPQVSKHRYWETRRAVVVWVVLGWYLRLIALGCLEMDEHLAQLKKFSLDLGSSLVSVA